MSNVCDSSVLLDQELTTRIRNFFRTQPFPNLRNLEVEVQRGLVTISGNLGTFYEKQLAIHSAHQAGGVKSLIDQIHVNE